MKLEEQNVQNLIDEIMAGKPGAFESLVRLYEKRTYHLAYRLCSNPEDALEITQDVFLKLYRNLSSFRAESSFSTWFYRLTTNVAYDYMRKRYREDKNRMLYPEEDEHAETKTIFPDTSPWPEELAEKNDLQRIMQDAFTKLSPVHREVLFLFDFENRTYEEIALLLDCQIGTVKSRIHRARLALKKIVLEQRELFEGYVRHTNQKGGE